MLPILSLQRTAKLGILPKKRVDLLSTSPPSQAQSQTQVQKPNSGQIHFDPDYQDPNDPNPSLPSAVNMKSIVAQIPKTPPGERGIVIGEEDDDELEYTR
jgi:hypothetical protein